MAEREEECKKTFKENTILHISLTILATCVVLIGLNMGIPIKVLVLLVFSIMMTFFSVFLMVWCFSILEEKRILVETRKEYARSLQSMEQANVNYSSIDDKERVKNNP